MEQKKNAAKFAFFYLLSLVGLVFVSVSVGTIIFQFINKFIDDPVGLFEGAFSNEAIKFAVASIFVAAPIFYIINRVIQKSLYNGELDREAGVRRWLTYFILFVSAVVMIGWLIGTIMNFLSGEMTLKFILKSITSLSIAAAVFSFYLHDIRRGEVYQKKDKVFGIFAYTSLFVVAVAFVSAFFVMDSPRESRNKRFDMLVINSFSNMDNCFNEYYAKNKKLPENMAEAIDNCTYAMEEKDLADPETKKKFEYLKKSESRYALCADFRASNKEEGKDYSYYSGPMEKNDLHDSGWQCLEREIDNKKNIEEMIKNNSGEEI